VTRVVYRSATGAGLRFRGRKRVLQQRLTSRERQQLLGFVIFGLITLAIAMYLGWWSAREEERQEKQQEESHAPHAQWMREPTNWRSLDERGSS